MSFVEPAFVVFFGVVFALYWRLGRLGQNVLLLVASAVFYGWVHPWFLLLLGTSVLLDYTMARLIVARPRGRRVWLGLSLAGNLGLLGTFKYLDFFVANVAALLTSVGVGANLPVLGLLLPAGISFYTFQTMSYTIDVFRGRVEARTNLLDHAVYVSFFPQLVAGPIERAHRLLPQVERARVWSSDAVVSGLGLALWGAVQKVCVADQVAPFVDRAFASEPGGVLLWAGALGFAVQILADFSGYTDIARGTARMLGFELVENFRRPYLARSPSDFWRRWHISFSTWIRDYVYIPLGGSRHGWWRTLVATAAALILSGLWHGASWNFVLWGAYHTVLIVAVRTLAPRLPVAWREHVVGDGLAVGLMFLATVGGWVIFREQDLDRLVGHLSVVPWSGGEAAWILAAATAVVAVAGGVVLAGGQTYARAVASPSRRPTALTLAVLAIATLASPQARDFIYFRF